MKISSKLAFLLGLMMAAVAGSAQAAYGYRGDYYDNDRYSDSSYYGDSYHRGADRYGRRIVRCESRDHRTAYCGVDTRGGVRLVNQISDRSCVRGRTWGADSRGIWVTDGCRGDFAINARGRDRGYGSGYGRTIRCESRNSRTVYCGVDSRAVIRLVNQLSRSDCIEGHTWGVSRRGLWVSRGCRAEFMVDSDRYGSDDYGYSENGYYDGYR